MLKLNLDQQNIGLMALSLLIAFVLPFELVLISYAFLGPAHYLTQISWMHDRNYFIDWKSFWIPCTLIVLLLSNLAFMKGVAVDKATYFLITLALSLSLSAVMFKSIWKRIALTSAITIAFWLAQMKFLTFAAVIVILIPTVIHIYVFSGAFILRGAIKDNNLWGKISFVFFVFCGVFFLFVTPMDLKISEGFVSRNIGMFEYVGKFMAHIFTLDSADSMRSLLGFLSFAYTYHYLNWFSKVNVIKWNQISYKRLIVLVALYIISIGIYLYDYQLGMSAIFFLSFLHVVLEFPLNVLTFKDLGSFIFKRG